VGARALAACRRAGGWDLFQAQRGARLRADPRTYAGHPDALDSLLAGEWRSRGYCSTRELVSDLDYLSVEALYVVAPERVVVCVPLWLGLPLADGPTAPTCGVLALAAGPADARRLESGVREHRRFLGDALAVSLVGVEEALAALTLSVQPRTVGVGSALLATLTGPRGRGRSQ